MLLPHYIFEGAVFITLEGDEVFSLISRDPDKVIYTVIGFGGENSIQVIDHRAKGLEAIDFVIETDDDNLFANRFCFPTLVHISETMSGVNIELFDLEDGIEPEFMLWIATGIVEPIPDYEYIFLRIEPLTPEEFAIASLFNYQRFQVYFDGWAVPIPVET